MTKQKETHTLIFIGREQLRKGGLGDQFVPLASIDEYMRREHDPANMTSIATIFKKGKGLVVGGLYDASCEIDEEGRVRSISFGSLAFKGRHDDTDQVKLWEIAHRAAEEAQKQENAEKRLRRDPALHSEIEALARLYVKTPMMNRLAVQRAIMAEIAAVAKKIERKG